METLHFSTHIDAPREIVWKTMLDDTTYREWTKAFNVGSYYEGDWSEGSKILFLGADEDGKLGGMVSMIAKNTPYEFLSIRHVGVIKDGVEDVTSDATKSWAGALENYTFKDADGGTELVVETDTTPEYAQYFKETWPKALHMLKELVENSTM